MPLAIRHTRLSAALANKVGRGALEERIRGEIGELIVEHGLHLPNLHFHVVDYGGTTFIVTPDDGDGVQVDVADMSTTLTTKDGRTFTMPRGAGRDDSET
jgi:hypothetical protein